MSGRLRIAYFVPPSRHFAGIERVVHEIATGLARDHSAAFDVHVVFATRYDEPLLTDPPYTAHVLDVGRLRAVATGLRRTVTAEKIDVLVTPQVEASVIAWLATRGPGAPLVVPHLHGNPRLEERDGTRRTRVAFALFRHLVARRVPGVLAVSHALRDAAAAGVAVHARRVEFVPNPVRDLTAGHPERTAHTERFRLLAVGRLSRQKGQDILLRALAIARPDLPPTVLTLVGNGPEEDALRRLADELGITDIVDFAGYSSDPAAHFRDADCFVLASRWEGFGVVLVEALQFGLPLVAADCEFGPSDVITDDRIGTLVAPEDPTALAKGLVAAVTAGEDPATEAARRETATGYRPDEAVAAHVGALRDLMGSARMAGRAGR
jgi:glycosyltransferase involved in cell wall biosynthesis